MAVTRISAGIYNVNGKTVRSATAPKDPSVSKPKSKAKPTAKNPNIAGTNIGKVTSGTAPVNRALNTGLEAGDAAARASNVTTNANVSNPFGTNEFVEGPDGRTTQKVSFSGDQQKILDQGEALTQGGQAWAQQQMGNFQQFNPDLSGAGRQKAADAAFAQLSRGMDTRQKQQSADLEQSLYNRGIQFSSDPNSRYQQEMASMRQGQEDERNNIANQAYNVGLGEQQAQFGMGQQANQTQLGNMQAMQGMGTGLMVPNFQQFQGNAVDPSVGASTAATFAQLKSDQPLKNAQAGYYKSKTTSNPSYGGSSGRTASNPSPFG